MLIGVVSDILKIALFHGEFREIPEALAQSGKYDIVFYGHSHRFEESHFGDTLLLNPGSCHRSFTEDDCPTVGTFDTSTRQFTAIKLQ